MGVVTVENYYCVCRDSEAITRQQKIFHGYRNLLKFLFACTATVEEIEKKKNVANERNLNVTQINNLNE